MYVEYFESEDLFEILRTYFIYIKNDYIVDLNKNGDKYKLTISSYSNFLDKNIDINHIDLCYLISIYLNEFHNTNSEFDLRGVSIDNIILIKICNTHYNTLIVNDIHYTINSNNIKIVFYEIIKNLEVLIDNYKKYKKYIKKSFYDGDFNDFYD